MHGDYSPKNVLVHDGRLILLDHEVIHIGDPGFDLGFSMTHLLRKLHLLPSKRDDFADATCRYWDVYHNIVKNDQWAENLEQRAIRHTLGCMLARVRGRSPLEYLNDTKRDRQYAAVITVMDDPPETVARLADRFTTAISRME